MKRAGFTLIEVLLSVTILATLSMLAARAISQAVKAKVKIQDQIDDVSRMRDALRLIERDVNLAYHHRDFEKELQDLVKKKNNPNPQQQHQQQNGLPQPELPSLGGPGNPANGSASREAERKDPTTFFMGNEEKMDFATMNNARMIKNSRQADFIEVGYSLKSCTSANGKTSSKCLWRRSSNVVDDDVTTGGDEVVLLENVTEFALKYIGKGKQDWVKEWKSDKTGDAATKDNFPAAVQISLTVQKETPGKGKKKYSMQITAPIHFPNNLDKGNSASGSTTLPSDAQSKQETK